MRWRIPAKTFLVGEYLALVNEPALILTTAPCFELTLIEKAGLHGIHPASPAGRFWASTPVLKSKGFQWVCPYQEIGGVGASSAQFAAMFQAYCHLAQQDVVEGEILTSYFSYVTTETGIQPSGYDVLAQCHDQCVYIENNHSPIISLSWAFQSLGFVLVHSGTKLATHEHLKNISLSLDKTALSAGVKQVYQAFQRHDERNFIDGINGYYQALLQHHLVASHVPKLLEPWLTMKGVRAGKGCGAMGADVILLVVDKCYQQGIIDNIRSDGYRVLATDDDLYRARPKSEIKASH